MKEDRIYNINRALAFLKLDDFSYEEYTQHEDISFLLEDIFIYALENKIVTDGSITNQDIFTSELINCFLMAPSCINNEFTNLYKKDKVLATDYFYNLSIASNYIMKKRVDKNIKWTAPCDCGDLIITINLSKPEKDPKEIEKAKLLPQSGYPKCLLCKENEGLCGSYKNPPRANHRILPITLNNEKWFFQYSPYVYYNEHCIILNSEHTPMVIDGSTFKKLLEFVSMFPHYFVGSNADLPIVGGSILSHEHFQGGRFDFPMATAKATKDYALKGYDDVLVQKIKWPLTVIRLTSENITSLVSLASHILDTFRGYSDETVSLIAKTTEPHNTITPIARFKNGKFELDLVLRNNRTTSEHPLGIFHPHSEYHNIKKENIGLIEVMGLAVLPARLKDELKIIADALNGDIDENEIATKLPIHLDFYNDLKKSGVKSQDEVYEKVGKVFEKVLNNCGIFKDDDVGNAGFDRFIATL
ncbi:MAG: UDP-glucose--hexose-1-phosphate uridylyltransferase [Clostridia bacterium]